MMEFSYLGSKIYLYNISFPQGKQDSYNLTPIFLHYGIRSNEFSLDSPHNAWQPLGSSNGSMFSSPAMIFLFYLYHPYLLFHLIRPWHDGIEHLCNTCNLIYVTIGVHPLFASLSFDTHPLPQPILIHDPPLLMTLGNNNEYYTYILPHNHIHKAMEEWVHTIFHHSIPLDTQTLLQKRVVALGFDMSRVIDSKLWDIWGNWVLDA